MANGHTVRNGRYRAKLRRRIVLFLGRKQNLEFNDDRGARCHYCWVEHKRLVKRKLEMDHEGRRQWKWSDLTQYQRYKTIAAEALDGLIKLACGTCNKKRWVREGGGIETIPF